MSERRRSTSRAGLIGSIVTLVALVSGCSSGPRVTPLVPPADGMQAADPALAIDPERGDVLLAWIGGDSSAWSLRFARSADHGRTWSAPVTVSPPGEPIHPHGESSPRLVAGHGGRIALFWSTSWEVPGRQWPASNVRFARSLDGGRAWSAPLTLNDDSTAAPGSHSFHGATLEGDSSLVAAWLDERPIPGAVASSDDASIYLARSPDFGRTWLANQPRWNAVCPCCRVQLAGNGSGQAVAAWRHHAAGQIRDVVLADLDGDAATVHDDGWRIEGCPHSGPSVCVAGDGTRHIAWYTGARGTNGVYYARAGAATRPSAPVSVVTGQSLPVGHVALALAPKLGPIVAWDVTAERTRRISLARPEDPGATDPIPIAVPGSEDGLYPQLAAFTERPGAIVAWTLPRQGRSGIGLASVEWGR